MSNTYGLTNYFLSNKFMEDINVINPLGTSFKIIFKFSHNNS